MVAQFNGSGNYIRKFSTFSAKKNESIYQIGDDIYPESALKPFVNAVPKYGFSSNDYTITDQGRNAEDVVNMQDKGLTTITRGAYTYAVTLGGLNDYTDGGLFIAVISADTGEMLSQTFYQMLGEAWNQLSAAKSFVTTADNGKTLVLGLSHAGTKAHFLRFAFDDVNKTISKTNHYNFTITGNSGSPIAFSGDGVFCYYGMSGTNYKVDTLTGVRTVMSNFTPKHINTTFNDLILSAYTSASNVTTWNVNSQVSTTINISEPIKSVNELSPGIWVTGRSSSGGIRLVSFSSDGTALTETTIPNSEQVGIVDNASIRVYLLGQKVFISGPNWVGELAMVDGVPVNFTLVAQDAVDRRMLRTYSSRRINLDALGVAASYERYTDNSPGKGVLVSGLRHFEFNGCYLLGVATKDYAPGYQVIDNSAGGQSFQPLSLNPKAERFSGNSDAISDLTLLFTKTVSVFNASIYGFGIVRVDVSLAGSTSVRASIIHAEESTAGTVLSGNSTASYIGYKGRLKFEIPVFGYANIIFGSTGSFAISEFTTDNFIGFKS